MKHIYTADFHFKHQGCVPNSLFSSVSDSHIRRSLISYLHQGQVLKLHNYSKFFVINKINMKSRKTKTIKNHLSNEIIALLYAPNCRANNLSQTEIK